MRTKLSIVAQAGRNFPGLGVFPLHGRCLGAGGMTDSVEFEKFVRRHQDMVFGMAVRMLGDPSEAEDVSQTVFLKAYERFDALRCSPAVTGWLRTVTTNLCLNHLTRFRARWKLFSQLRSGGEGRDRPYEDMLVANDDQSEDLARAEQNARLERGIRLLPPHQRVPIVLYHFEERSYREIADALGVSLGKVKTDIHRGREALRNLIGENDDAS